MAAHRRREYILSIPALLSQVEGVVGDAMILKIESFRKVASFTASILVDRSSWIKEDVPSSLEG